MQGASEGHFLGCSIICLYDVVHAKASAILLCSCKYGNDFARSKYVQCYHGYPDLEYSLRGGGTVQWA